MGVEDGMIEGVADGTALGFKVGRDDRIVVGTAVGSDDGASGMST